LAGVAAPQLVADRRAAAVGGDEQVTVRRTAVGEGDADRGARRARGFFRRPGRAAEGDRARGQVPGEQAEQPGAGQAEVRVAVARRRLGDVNADQWPAPVITGFQQVDGRAGAVEAYAELGQDARAVGPQRDRRAAAPPRRRAAAPRPARTR
jgi:hypothetical protein